MAATELTPVEQTALLTAYARAMDSRWARPILGDKLADEVVGRIDYDFAGLGVQTSVVCQAAHAQRSSTTGSARSSTSIGMPSWSTSVPGCKHSRWRLVSLEMSTTTRARPTCSTASTRWAYREAMATAASVLDRDGVVPDALPRLWTVRCRAWCRGTPTPCDERPTSCVRNGTFRADRCVPLSDTPVIGQSEYGCAGHRRVRGAPDTW
jgi:hypothetical protein